jgi:cyanate permease
MFRFYFIVLQLSKQFYINKQYNCNDSTDMMSCWNLRQIYAVFTDNTMAKKKDKFCMGGFMFYLFCMGGSCFICFVGSSCFIYVIYIYLHILVCNKQAYFSYQMMFVSFNCNTTSHVELELLTLLEHLGSPPVFIGVHVAQFLFFCVAF